MRALRLVFVLTALSALAQTITFTPASLEVTETTLTPLPDGGCEARWCGRALSDDGGVELAGCTSSTELKAAANQNRCTALLSAGVNRVGRALRFDLDAGTQ